MEYQYYLSQLSEQEAVLYASIFSGIRTRIHTIDVDASIQTVHKIIKAIMMDHPELFWFQGKWKATTEGKALHVIPRYTDSATVRERTANLENVAQVVLNSCSGGLVDQIKSVYDWLIDNVQYGLCDHDQTVEGVFVDRRALCKGIAKAFQLLMNRLEIPSFLIEGTLDGEAPHIWNVIYVNERFYHVDVTMGYQRFEQWFFALHRNRHYPCFMVSDQTIAVTHKVCPGRFPDCTDDFDLNRYLVGRLDIPEKYRSRGMLRYLDKGSTCTVLKVTGMDSDYVIKVMETGDRVSKYRNACAELEKMKLLRDCMGSVHMIDGDVSERNGRVFLLLRYVKPLTVRRKEKDFDPVKSTLRLGVDVLDALIECRDRGIYHLDIQPKNIYFETTGRAVLGDFGAARFERQLNGIKQRVGTLAFMAPEVYWKAIYGQPSEIYSLGIVMYALMNDAKLPFMHHYGFQDALKLRLSGRDLPQPCMCPEPIWQCIKKMCAYDPEKRYSSYEQAKDALSSLYVQSGSSGNYEGDSLGG